jgi:predicted acyltransferase
MHRLSLYTEAYGLTTARVHAAAILVWIALTLLLFCVTVLRGKRNVLPFAMVVSGYLVLLGMNAVNPDALVARVNLTRLATDGRFDPQYTFRLSADAVPVLLEAVPTIEAVQRSALAGRLLQDYASPVTGQDLRTWNAARATASALVREREAELRGYVIPSETSGTTTR